MGSCVCMCERGGERWELLKFHIKFLYNLDLTFDTVFDIVILWIFA